jgi:DnaJ-class molecular chaperone
MGKEKCLYQVLGLTPEASAIAIAQAYSRCLQSIHPDTAKQADAARIP